MTNLITMEELFIQLSSTRKICRWGKGLANPVFSRIFENPQRYSHLHLLVTTAHFVQFFRVNTSLKEWINPTVLVFYSALEHSEETCGDDTKCTNDPAKATWPPKGNHSPLAQTQINFGCQQQLNTNEPLWGSVQQQTNNLDFRKWNLFNWVHLCKVLKSSKIYKPPYYVQEQLLG